MTVGDDVKAVWVASMPRTGSMWTYNIIRDLLRGAGHTVRPDVVPYSDAEMLEVGLAGARNTAGEVYVLKVHGIPKDEIPNSHFVLTHRDIRDTMLSYMRFLKVDFEAGLKFIEEAMPFEKYIKAITADHRTDVNYTDIIEQPAGVAAHIAADLEIDVKQSEIDAIVGRYTKQAVAARIDQAERNVAAKINSRLSLSMGEVVVGPRNIMRAFDRDTGFQSGHVSSYREGDWQDVLFPAQKRRLAEHIAAMRLKHGLD